MSTCSDFTGSVLVTDLFPLTTDWRRRVIANGGAVPSNLTLSACLTFESAISTLKSKYKTLNIFAPDSMIACLTPFIVGNGKDPYTNGGGGSVTQLGYTGGGVVNGIIDTGLNPSTVFTTISNGGWSVYFCSIASAGTAFGCRDTANGKFFMCNPQLPNFFAWCFDNGTTNLSGLGVGGQTSGYYSVDRINANDFRAFHAASGFAFAQLGQNLNLSSQTGPNANFFLAGENLDGVPTADAAGRIYGYAAIHDGFTSAQSQLEFNAVQALRTAIGGAV